MSTFTTKQEWLGQSYPTPKKKYPWWLPILMIFSIPWGWIYALIYMRMTLVETFEDDVEGIFLSAVTGWFTCGLIVVIVVAVYQAINKGGVN